MKKIFLYSRRMVGTGPHGMRASKQSSRQPVYSPTSTAQSRSPTGNSKQQQNSFWLLESRIWFSGPCFTSQPLTTTTNTWQIHSTSLQYNCYKNDYEQLKDVAMQSHKWLCAHEKPSAEPVESAASTATMHTNAEQLESSQKQQKSKKDSPQVVGRRDVAQKAQAESRKQV